MTKTPAHTQETPRRTGVLLRLHTQGYGFIRPDDGSPDFFVSINSMRDRAHWIEGTHVEFSPGKLYRVAPGQKSKATPALDVVAVSSLAPRGQKSKRPPAQQTQAEMA